MWLLVALVLTLGGSYGYRGLPWGRSLPRSCRESRLRCTSSRHPEPLVIKNDNLTLAFSRSFDVPHPSYVQILREGILSVTSFSLMRKGVITEYDISDIAEKKLVPKELLGNYLWPNELSRYIDNQGNPVLLVPDGFLTPGQSDGGLFTITNPEMPRTKPKRITALKPGWFYHKAVYLEIPISPMGEEGDVAKSGQQRVTRGVLTARANKPVLGRGLGELVWLSMPDAGESEEGPWAETVLAEGPDVMFEVTDLHADDGLIDIISAHFFGDKISIASIKATDSYPHVKVERTMTIDTKGKPYGLCLAKLREGGADDKHTHLLVSTHECAYDMPGAFNTMVMGSTGDRYPSMRSGEKLGEQAYRNPYEVGGSLYAYEIPSPSQDGGDPSIFSTAGNGVYDVKAWRRSTLFQGFKVKSWGNVNPGAPGFPYVFYLDGGDTESSNSGAGGGARPMILLAGDGTRSAYIFSPSAEHADSDEPKYKLAFEVECGATVGSAAVSSVSDGSGDVEIVVPSYELNKVHLYRLSKARAEADRSGSRGALPGSVRDKLQQRAAEATRVGERKDVLLFSTEEQPGSNGASAP